MNNRPTVNNVRSKERAKDGPRYKPQAQPVRRLPAVTNQMEMEKRKNAPGRRYQASETVNDVPSSSNDNGDLVVVTFVGRNGSETAQLLDRLLDCEVFTNQWTDPEIFGSLAHESSNFGHPFKHWPCHVFQHYHSEEENILYVSLECGIACDSHEKNDKLSLESREEMQLDGIQGKSTGVNKTRDLEECGRWGQLAHEEANAMKALLLAFCVSHVVVLLQDMPGVDPHVLQSFRTLQKSRDHLLPLLSSPHPLPLPSPIPAARPKKLPLNSLPSPTLLLLFPHEDEAHSIKNEKKGNEKQGKSAVDFQLQASSPSFFPPSTHSLSPASFNISREKGTPGQKGESKVGTLRKRDESARKQLLLSLEVETRSLLKKCRIVNQTHESQSEGSTRASSSSAFRGSSTLFSLDPSTTALGFNKTKSQPASALFRVSETLEDIFAAGSNYFSSRSLSFGYSYEAVAKEVEEGNEDVKEIRAWVSKQAEAVRSGRPSSTGGGYHGTVRDAASMDNSELSDWILGCQKISKALLQGGVPAPGAGNETETVTVPLKLPVGTKTAGILKIPGGISALGLKPSPKPNPPPPPPLLPHLPSKSPPTASPIDQTLIASSSLDFHFSVNWCKRVFPTACEKYFRNLPDIYTASLHALKKSAALSFFQASVKGRARDFFLLQLAEYCDGVWKSGRQQCEAVSLSGRPCLLPLHTSSSSTASSSSSPPLPSASSTQPDSLPASSVPLSSLHLPLPPTSSASSASSSSSSSSHPFPPASLGSLSLQGTESSISQSVAAETAPHESSAVFLHACNCGSSRRIRDDPFDLPSANLSFYSSSSFTCCKALQKLSLSSNSDPGQSQPSMSAPIHCQPHDWSVLHLGSSSSYNPSKGLQGAGFMDGWQFLSPWQLDLPEKSTLQKEATRGAALMAVAEIHRSGRWMAQSTAAPSPSTASSSSGATGTGTGAGRRGVPGRIQGANQAAPRSRQRGGGKGGQAGGGFSATGATKGTPGGAMQEEDFPPLAAGQVAASGRMGGKKGGKKEAAGQSGPASVNVSRAEDFPPLPTARQSLRALPGILPLPPSTAGVSREHSEKKGTVKHEAEEEEQKSRSVGLATVTVFLGLELECPQGHRFLYSPPQEEHRQQPQSQAGREGTPHQHRGHRVGKKQASVATPVVAVGAKEREERSGGKVLESFVPLFSRCRFCESQVHSRAEELPEGKAFGGSLAQLHRIYIVTPDHPVEFSTAPIIQFGSAQEHTYFFGISPELRLQPDSFVCVRLPHVYAVQTGSGQPLLMTIDQVNPDSSAWLKPWSAVRLVASHSIKSICVM